MTLPIIDKLKNCVFEVEVIENVLRVMIFTGFLKETKIDSRVIDVPADIHSIKLREKGVWAEVSFSDDSEARMYYDVLLQEFEYIYYMSEYYVSNLTSDLVDSSLNEQKINYIDKAKEELGNIDEAMLNRYAKKEFSVVLFLIALFYVMKFNIEKQMECCTRESFKKYFCSTDLRGKDKVRYPWDRMIQEIILTLERKAERNKWRYDKNGEDWLNEKSDCISMLHDKLKTFFDKADT